MLEPYYPKLTNIWSRNYLDSIFDIHAHNACVQKLFNLSINSKLETIIQAFNLALKIPKLILICFKRKTYLYFGFFLNAVRIFFWFTFSFELYLETIAISLPIDWAVSKAWQKISTEGLLHYISYMYRYIIINIV